MSKIKLNKYETAIVLASKGWGIKLSSEYDKSFDFKDNQQIFNLWFYRKIAYIFADWCAIPIDSVKIEHINSRLYELFVKITPNKVNHLMNDIIYSAYNKQQSKNDLLFTKIYGYIQAATMKDNDLNDIYDLDEELIIIEEEK